MNYYKQGDAVNADKIKAAFEKLGYDVTGFDMCNDNVLFFTYKLQTGANVISTTNAHIYTASIIKTHPDYKELPLEPLFKVGDWIVQNDNGTVSQITKVINAIDEDGEYRAYEHTNGYFAECFENDYHIWTIADAKDGDVLVYPNEIYQDEIFLFNLVDNNSVLYHCCFDGNLVVHSFYGFSNEELLHVHPATKEQRKLLFQKMKETGYQWDADKKKLRKINPHYNISNFHVGMPVLVRETSLNAWQYVLFSHCYVGGDGLTRFNAGLVGFNQCIPFNEETKHLLGTTNPCDERFINW